VPTASPGASLEAMLITIGADQPEQEETMAEPRMNAPTRVNVANRHLGNKVCFQGTIIVYSKKILRAKPTEARCQQHQQEKCGVGAPAKRPSLSPDKNLTPCSHLLCSRQKE
jgi:hypothetical protein